MLPADLVRRVYEVTASATEVGSVAPALPRHSARGEEACRTLEAILRECRDPRTGEAAVSSIERPWTRDPLTLTGSEADLLVVWRGVTAALDHPRLGLIGPVRLRRTVASLFYDLTSTSQGSSIDVRASRRRSASTRIAGPVCDAAIKCSA